MRWRRWFFLGLPLLGISAAAPMFINNNWSVRSISRSEFLAKLDNAVASSRNWVLARAQETDSLATESPMALLGNAPLMHMVADCASASRDERLRSLAARYFTVNGAPF